MHCITSHLKFLHIPHYVVHHALLFRQDDNRKKYVPKPNSILFRCMMLCLQYEHSGFQTHALPCRLEQCVDVDFFHPLP